MTPISEIPEICVRCDIYLLEIREIGMKSDVKFGTQGAEICMIFDTE